MPNQIVISIPVILLKTSVTSVSRMAIIPSLAPLLKLFLERFPQIPDIKIKIPI